MEKTSEKKRSRSLPERRKEKELKTLIRAEQTENASGETQKKGFVTRCFDRMGYEVDFGELKNMDFSPSHVWDRARQGARNVAENARETARSSKVVLFSKQLAYDKLLFLSILALVIVGLTMMASASYAYAYNQYGNSMYFIQRQLLFVVLGVVVMFWVSTISPKIYNGGFAAFLWCLSVVLLILVRILPGKKGVHRWIELGPISFQPSEIAKFTVILVCASYIASHYHEINMLTFRSEEKKRKYAQYGSVKRWGYEMIRSFQTSVWPFAWRVGIILGLLVVEPHLSCTIIVMLIAGTMMFLAGTRKEYFLILLGIAVAFILLVVVFGVVPYGRARFEMWLDPFADVKGDGWQTIQSLYAISSGGIFGAGFGNSRQKYMYIAEPQNDFVFSVVSEEVGLVGAVLIILLFVFFIWRGFVISVTNQDRFQRFMGIGITLQVGYQMILNVAVVSNLVPNTGISLPFFSYGGTSLLMLMFEMGVLLAISRSSTNRTI